MLATELNKCLPRPPKAGECDLKCLSQGYNQMVQVRFEPRPCQSQSQHSKHSNMLPKSVLLYQKRGKAIKSSTLNKRESK